MFEYIIKNPRVGREMEAAGFKSSLEALAARLHSQGYAKTTGSFDGQAAVHFAYWVARRRVERLQINEDHMAKFLLHHLPTCRCSFGGVRQDKTVRAGLRYFEAVLNSRSAAPPCGPRLTLLLGRNHTLLAQKIEQMPERGSIT